jgi:hypothetical protein
MTTEQLKSTAESLPIGVASKDIAESTATVLEHAFDTARPVSVPNAISLDSLVAELESEPSFATELSNARRSAVFGLRMVFRSLNSLGSLIRVNRILRV